MSLHILANGTLANAPVKHTSTKGKPYVTANLRVTAEDSSLLVSVICFEPAACEVLGALKRGDAASVTGRAKLTEWTGKDGLPRHGLSMVADRALALKPKARKPSRRKEAKPAGAYPFFDDPLPDF